MGVQLYIICKFLIRRLIWEVFTIVSRLKIFLKNMGIYRTAVEEARDLRVGSPRASRLWLSQWETSLRQGRVCRSRYHQTPSPTYTLLLSTRLNPNKILTAPC